MLASRKPVAGSRLTGVHDDAHQGGGDRAQPRYYRPRRGARRLRVIPGMSLYIGRTAAKAVPELQRHDLFRREYPDGTLRDMMDLATWVRKSGQASSTTRTTSVSRKRAS